MRHNGRQRQLAWLLMGLALQGWMLTTAARANIANPQQAEGDLVLPMPGGLSMVFRPVFLGEGGAPFALKRFKVGDPSGGFRENLTQVVVGGAFKTTHQGQADWLYYMGKYEVTEAQYAAIMEPHDTAKQASQYPLRQVSWFAAQEFIHKYNLWLFEHAREALPKHEDTVGYVRLPTEIEWEFAARGGAAVSPDKFDARHPYANPLNKQEWFSGPTSSHDKVQKVGILAPNALFLHDMLGNVSEMTASFYQIEYYQGRVGGFVARGGNYTTPEDRVRASLRSEQPFYRDLKPQSSPTLGMRLLLSSVVFAARSTSAELEAAWPDYRKGGVGATAPAAVSVAPPATQTNLQLADAAGLIDRLLGDTALSSGHKHELERLRASFGNIEKTIKQAEVDSAYAWIEIATARALFLFRALKEVPARQKTIEIAKQAGRTAVQASLVKNLNDLTKDIDEKWREYADSLQQLDRNEQDSIERAMQKYHDQLSRTGDYARLMILTEAVRKHFDQYTKDKRSNVSQWQADFEKL